MVDSTSASPYPTPLQNVLDDAVKSRDNAEPTSRPATMLSHTSGRSGTFRNNAAEQEQEHDDYEEGTDPWGLWCDSSVTSSKNDELLGSSRSTTPLSSPGSSSYGAPARTDE